MLSDTGLVVSVRLGASCSIWGAVEDDTGVCWKLTVLLMKSALASPMQALYERAADTSVTSIPLSSRLLGFEVLKVCFEERNDFFFLSASLVKSF